MASDVKNVKRGKSLQRPFHVFHVYHVTSGRGERMGQYLDIAKQVEARLPGGSREESTVVVQEPPATEPRTQATCSHQKHFPPTPTDGPTRQCRYCPYVWQAPCGCG